MLRKAITLLLDETREINIFLYIYYLKKKKINKNFIWVLITRIYMHGQFQRKHG